MMTIKSKSNTFALLALLVALAVVVPVAVSTGEVDSSSSSSNNNNNQDLIDSMMTVGRHPHERILMDAHQLLVRSLQSNGSSSSNPCASQSDTVQACLNANVGSVNSTVGQQCMDCYWQKQEIALDDFRQNPTIDCGPLNDNVCTPVSQCACLEPCDNEISALSDCSLKTSFADNGIQLNCTISCTGTNSTVTDDSLANSTDDFVGGLCRGEESAVKLCLESMGSSLDQCGSCLKTTQAARVSTSTTCSDLQQITCDRINSCQCVDECKTELLALWNCDIDFAALDYPQLSTCDQFANCPAGGSSSSSTSTSGAAAAEAGFKGGRQFLMAVAAAAVTVLATAA